MWKGREPKREEAEKKDLHFHRNLHRCCCCDACIAVCALISKLLENSAQSPILNQAVPRAVQFEVPFAVR